MKIVFDLHVEVDCAACEHHSTYIEIETLYGRLVERSYCRAQKMHLSSHRHLQPSKCSSFNLKYKKLCELSLT